MKSILPLLFTLFGLNIFAQNSALSFDGQEEYLSLSHNDSYNIETGLTMEAWIFAEEWAPFQWMGSIINKDNQSPDRGFAFRCGNNGTLSFVMAVDNSWEEAFTSQIMNTNQWHHVAVVIDNGTIRLYVDGQESANHSFTGNPSHSPDMPINIGGSPGFSGRHFKGVIDEVRIWDEARTQEELINFMTTNLSGTEANLVAYFPMNEGSGNVAGDLSSTGNDCALTLMDDSNWVDGYTLPDYDISVQRVYGVDVINMIDRPVKLKVDIQNTGIQAISDISLAVSINNEVYNTETVSSSIEPNDVLAYEFVLPIDIIGLTDPEIEISASHPEDGNVLNNTSSLNIKTGESDKIIVSNQALHKNGLQQNSTFMTLPNDLHRYEQMLLNIDLSCPSGGCGAWDVLSDLKAITHHGTFELARYITPYGIACGGWVVDITDFKSILGGQVEFLTSITVYTEEGWLVDMSIDLIDNNEEDTYSMLSPLWQESYHVYGDPGISDNLVEIPVQLQTNTETNHVRMTVTGHGQGNTNNAAEFFEVDHTLKVNGNAYNNHHLWKNDCAQNPCSNQAGSWLFSRAGWCPGESVDPYIINTTSTASAGELVNLDYELQEYTNLLNTGYNGSGHTEPYYRIYSYFIENSSVPYNDYSNLAATNTAMVINGNTLEAATLNFKNNGFEDVDAFTINVFYDNTLVASESFNEMISVGSSLEKNIMINTLLTGIDDIFIIAEVVADTDDNPGDNVVKSDLITSTKDQLVEYPFNIFPNPTPHGIFNISYDEFWRGSTVRIFNATAVVTQELVLEAQNTESVQLTTVGAYWYTVVHPTNGNVHVGKILFVE